MIQPQTASHAGEDSAAVKRVLFVAYDYHPNAGGVAEYNARLVAALVERGCNVVVVAPRTTACTQAADGIATKTIRIGESDASKKSYGIVQRTLATLHANKELTELVRRLKRDFNPDFAVVSPVSVWAHAVAAAGIPYCVCVHGADALGRRADRLRTLYRRRAVRAVLANAESIFTNSDFTAGQLLDAGFAARSAVTTTYCGVAPDLLRQAEELHACTNSSADSQRLLTVSRLVPFKACDVLIRAVARLKTEFPAMSLTVAGDGPERSRLEALSVELGAADAVRFLGYVADPESKARLFLEHPIFVQSGRLDPRSDRVENFGIVFAEAGAFCRAAVGPRIGGVPEVIEDGVTGFLAEPDSVDSLVVALRKLLLSPQLTASMGRRGRERVTRLFGYDRIAGIILSAFPPSGPTK